MIVDRTLIEDYPFSGKFSRLTIDESKPLGERTETETVILETSCDIQEASRTEAWGANNVTFVVYYPFDPKVGVNIMRGDVFEGDMYGIEVVGEVNGIFPSQLGGCEVHLKEYMR